MNRLVVLGGSTPFTAALVDAIRDRAEYLAPRELVLHGRNEVNLAIVTRYAQVQLRPQGWDVVCSTNLKSALEGASIVVHQVRYGGMRARSQAEDVSLAFGIAPDETLGPGALYSALRLMPQLDQVAATLVRECPDAWVLNLTNPLSLTTARMIGQGVLRCVGLCELPRVTFQRAAAILGKDPRDGAWSYVGLNHRGFIVQLAWSGRDYIDDLANCLGSERVGGITAQEIRALSAIPTKYFRLFASKRLKPTSGRAAFLAGLRQQILDELRENPHDSPPSCKQRDMAWYERSVVPMIEALSADEATLQEVNQLTAHGLVEEGRAWVSKGGVQCLIDVSPGCAVMQWLERLRNHERCMMRAIDSPNLDTLGSALDADPMVSPDKIHDCAQYIRSKLGAIERLESQKAGELKTC